MVASSYARRAASLVLLFASAAVGADTISIRADEWLPYNGPGTKKPPGYMIELAEKIAVATRYQETSSQSTGLVWSDTWIVAMPKPSA